MIYIIVFIFSLFSFKMAQVYKKNKICFYLFSSIAIIVPCLLASMRDISIGTDTDEYVKRIFEQALIENNIFNFFLHPNSNVIDLLYLFTSFICAKISKNISLLFFVNELLVILPIYIALLKSNKKSMTKGVVFGMFLFFMFFYNQTFNLVRQSIALAFSILAMVYLDEGKTSKFIVFCIVAFLFHSTAAIMLPIYILYRLENSKKLKEPQRKNINIIILIMITIMVIFLPTVVSIFVSMGISPTKLNHFLEVYVRNFDMNTSNTLFYLFIAFIVYINRNNLKTKVANFKFYGFVSILCVFILQFGARIKFSERIGYYIFYPLIFLVLPKLMPKEGEKITRHNLTVLVLLALGFIFYWIYWIIILKYHETYPFVFYGG